MKSRKNIKLGEIARSEPERPKVGSFLPPEIAEKIGGRAADMEPTPRGLAAWIDLKMGEGGDAGSATTQAYSHAMLAYQTENRKKGPKQSAENRAKDAIEGHEAWRAWALAKWTEQYRGEAGLSRVIWDRWQMARGIKAAMVQGAAAAKARTIVDALKGVKGRAKRAAESAL